MTDTQAQARKPLPCCAICGAEWAPYSIMRFFENPPQPNLSLCPQHAQEWFGVGIKN